VNTAVMFSSGKDDWGTPPDLFAALDAEFHFTLDAAANHKNALCKNYFSEEVDALNRAWVIFACDCLHELRSGVSGDSGVLRAEAGEAKRPELVVSPMRAREGKKEAGVETRNRAGEGESREEPAPLQPEGESMEARFDPDSEPQTSWEGSAVPVDDGRLAEMPADLRPSVRVLRGRASGTGPRDSIERSGVSRHCAVEHGSGLSEVQPRPQAESGACATCGVPTRPATTWLNCPYSKGLQKQFIAKAAAERLNGVTTVMLLPARTDTKAFHAHIWDASANHPRTGVEVRFLKGRLKFIGATHGAPFPSMVVVFRP
jgi:hypothetical protein